MSSLSIVTGRDGKSYIKCDHGHGSFRCGSYVTINKDGAFHFSTYPVTHGFTITLKEVLEIAKEQGKQFEEAVNHSVYQAEGQQEIDLGNPSEARKGASLEDGGLLPAGQTGNRDGVQPRKPVQVLITSCCSTPQHFHTFKEGVGGVDICLHCNKETTLVPFENVPELDGSAVHWFKTNGITVHNPELRKDL